VLGSARYIAPEVALGGAAEERSDVYSLGCVLYEMLTGQPPFTAELDAAVLHQHVNASPRPTRELAGEIPPALESLISRMLSKRVTERPAAGELSAALAGILPRASGNRRPQPARRPLVPAGEGRATAPAGDSTARLSVPGPARTRRRATLGIAALVVAVLVGVGFAASALTARDGPGSSNAAAAARAQRHTHTGARDAHRPTALTALASGAFREAAHLAGTAASALQAAQTAIPAEAPPHRAAAPKPKRANGTHPKKHAEAPTSEPRESETATEAEPPTETAPTETAPSETAPTEAAPPPPPASGPLSP
jgi:serine/threonine-protein kinase